MQDENSNRSSIYKIDLDLDSTNDARLIGYNYITSESTVLDVGSACGDFGALIKKEKNCNVFGIEYDTQSIKIAQKLNVYQQLHQINLNIFDENDYKMYFDSFDSIVLLDVLEHLLDPEKVLASLKKFLKEDGYFIISLPNIAFCDIKVSLLEDDFTYTDTGILDRTHIKFFTYKTIITFMTSLSLKIKECQVVVHDLTLENKLPGNVKKFIVKDPHSFVYQYVMKVYPSNDDISSILLHNTECLKIKWSYISPELKRIRKQKIISKVFPVGTFQYKIGKYIKTLLGR